ncbi:MAG: ABC transporter ATP-binding protein [Bacillota bacterium]|nr:ABC transporter ATP-binding protein [Bacillota bacterium]
MGDLPELSVSPKLSVQNISKVFSFPREQITALSDLSLDVGEGEFVTILGPSGCGKSTLLKIIAGLTFPTTGAVFLNSKQVTGPGRDRGMVFQSYTLFPWLTVRQNIEFGLKLQGFPNGEREAVVTRYLHLIGLTGFEDAYPKSLSGGMKQRVAIARALATDPEVLLMDEPFGALDAQTRALMQELLVQIWEETKKTIIFVTHDVEEGIFLGDTLYVMTARPGRFKAKISIPLQRPRRYEVRSSRHFLDLKQEVLALIREESLRALEMRELKE